MIRIQGTQNQRGPGRPNVALPVLGSRKNMPYNLASGKCYGGDLPRSSYCEKIGHLPLFRIGPVLFFPVCNGC
jgi:hypothetical protein